MGMMMKGLSTRGRPTCAHCGKLYGKRETVSELVRWDTPTRTIETTEKVGGARDVYILDGDPLPPPPYGGNGVVVEETKPYLSADTHAMVMTRYVWDGESWTGGYDPFCTLRCALAYARKAYNARRPT